MNSTDQLLSAQTADAQAERKYQDCAACRIIGTGTLGVVGLYALNMSRAHQPGSLIGKRIMAGVGVAFLVGSVARWRM
ncbi:hypothetical protein DENSPDRAFT_807738 [Dentipellis sp. KUC8613]|nr:hypothetical protein DENSPDRAFT_807738 [Dentipellis sp. KUC8613]